MEDTGVEARYLLASCSGLSEGKPSSGSPWNCTVSTQEAQTRWAGRVQPHAEAPGCMSGCGLAATPRAPSACLGDRHQELGSFTGTVC